ncbi:hypothetical protein CLV79_109127 [Limimaricola soesokkakensis]|uniref:DUF2332 domain-containing protein n=2 Tax=Limimaricola soesokkakensis TaxID=1343159 RepID=A0A1X6ZQX3_9RHOB|nr:DUF2332 family protein [Limimaricola soesokkakensis]PSK84153.1 hypothetical protein CLV79_109127 [Limimaricola soesokkakensis]SLN58281.1 hypothetical protein LOS8367_02770 [Limimaricola soesokkakensis]
MNRMRVALTDQSRHCDALGSPFMRRLMALLSAHWPLPGAVAERLDAWPGEVGSRAAALPLRLAGGLHALVLQGRDAEIAAAYPPHAVSDDELLSAVTGAMQRHEGFLLDWIQSPPQTNEVRRAAALIATAHLLTDRFGLPIRLSELGASGGLNLGFDGFGMEVQDRRFGPEEASVVLHPDWKGPLPPVTEVTVAERRGVDLAPLEPSHPDDALRLIAYLWPDQTDRIERTRAAMDLRAPGLVDRADAIDWLEPRLAAALPDHLHIVFHSIAWQYFPPEAQERGRALIEAAGACASEAAPLAWVSMEADGEEPGARIGLRLWPGDHDITLGRIDFHGRWLCWTGPERLDAAGN